jgi:hypothetical protein
MFSYVVDFTHLLFFLQTFSTAIKIVLENYLKNEVRNARQTKSCSLVASLLCDAANCESIFCMSHRKKQQ